MYNDHNDQHSLRLDAWHMTRVSFRTHQTKGPWARFEGSSKHHHEKDKKKNLRALHDILHDLNASERAWRVVRVPSRDIS
jgi:hypothetical protein